MYSHKMTSFPRGGFKHVIHKNYIDPMLCQSFPQGGPCH
jgi:hypothetical protein